ncbi:hypothetical protein JTB14_006903 [Gonioctena quinquepunctata]|nr:hypothetical protein JTB14_006903 [Gonioctena quinquepunctata]
MYHILTRSNDGNRKKAKRVPAERKKRKNSSDTEWNMNGLEESDSSTIPEEDENSRISIASDSIREPSNNYSECSEGLEKIDNIVNSNELSEPKICEFCDRAFDTNLDFALHSIIHSEKARFSCHICGTDPVSEEVLRKHMKSHDKYQCTVCKVTKKNRKAAYNHSKNHAYQPELIKCRLCKKEVKRMEMKDHDEREHKGSTPGSVKCCVCSKDFPNRRSLMSHCSYVHKDIGVNTTKVCEICGKEVINKQVLRDHMRIHTEERPFDCPQCPRKFRQSSALKKHMRSHTGECPFECEICGKKYKYWAGFDYHMKTHTGEKSHCCPICGRAFVTKANMSVHMRICGLSKSKLL